MFKVTYFKYELGTKVSVEKYFRDEFLALDFAEKMYEKYQEKVIVKDESSNTIILEINP